MADTNQQQQAQSVPHAPVIPQMPPQMQQQMQAGQPQVMTEQQALASILGESPKERVYDLSKDEHFAHFLADVAEENGFHKQAARLRGKPFENTWTGAAKRAWNHNVKVSTVVKVLVVAAGAYLLYSGIAYYFSLPGGIFGKQDDGLDEMVGGKPAKK